MSLVRPRRTTQTKTELCAGKNEIQLHREIILSEHLIDYYDAYVYH